jgi:Carboxypeptidase regulatory-like domain/TonB-dependent Receptor Plug Domain/TonB dependent receptor
MRIIGSVLGNKCLRGFYAGNQRMLGILLVFAGLLGLSPGVAQTITGTVRGTITDPTGAIVAGVSVAATNVATNVKTDSITNRDGIYNIQFLPIGSYTITITAPGFETTSIGPFSLEIDQVAKIDAKLKVGNASTTVSVSSEVSPLLQTQDATLESTISGNTLSTMPLNGLNFQFATLFVPGSVDPSLASMASADGNERTTDWLGTPSFNGNRAQTNNYILDGVEMNETINNLSAYNPAPDAIQEMRVITGNANAEYGNVNGGEILVVTKGGTNNLHGSLYDLFQNNSMAATSWANSFANLPQTPFTQDQFGATIGGPIKRDKLFLFGDYLGFRYHSGGEAAATVPTVRMRTCTPNGGITTCDFSELLGSQFGNIQLYNNQNGQGFANATPYVNDQIPLVSPAAKFLFANTAALPLPNATPVAGEGDLDNYDGFTKGQTVNNQGDARVDWKASDRNAVMGRYTYGKAYDFYPLALAPVFFPADNYYPFQSVVGTLVHTFSPALVNEFRPGFTREVWNQGVPGDPDGQFGTSGNSKIGLPFPNQPFPGFSQMAFSSWESNMGTTAIVTQFHENNFFYGDNLTWQRGVHTLKFGAQIVRYQQNIYYSGNGGALGSFSYTGQYTANPNAGATDTGYGLADFVMDQSASANIGGVSGDNGQRQYRNAYYAQDDWKVRHNLTVNLGLRYAHDQPIYEVHNREASVNVSNMNDISASGIELAGQNGNSRALYNPYYLEFMPRLGFALQVSPRFVIRGGYGVTDDLEGTGVNWRMTQNAPFQGSFVAAPTPPSPTSSGLAPLPLENGFSLSPGALSVSYFNYNAWDPNMKPALIQQFNMAWQYMIDSKTSAQIGYVGELGQHLVTPTEADQFTTPASGVLADGDCSGTIAPAAPACNLVGNWGNFQYTESEGYSNYNAMQATLHRQNSNGIEFTFNYVWAKAMTNNAGFYGVAGVNEGSSFFQDFRNPHGDYGPAGQDARNAFNGYWTYQLPFGRGQKFGSNVSRAADEALGGWKLSGDVIMYSGFPLTMGSYENYYVNSWAAHAIHFRRLHVANRSTQNWFGTDPSATPCLATDANGNTIDNGTCAYGGESYTGFGNAQNGSERAPGFRQVDLSAFKTFKITEKQTLQLRGEAFNALNLASYAPPNNNLYSPQLGLITATNSSQRIMQVSMHYRF